MVIFFIVIYSLSVSIGNNVFVNGDTCVTLVVKYIWTRFILRRKSAPTNHSISVLSLYSFNFGLMEHSPPPCREEERYDDDDAPYGKKPALVVRR